MSLVRAMILVWHWLKSDWVPAFFDWSLMWMNSNSLHANLSLKLNDLRLQAITLPLLTFSHKLHLSLQDVISLHQFTILSPHIIIVSLQVLRLHLQQLTSILNCLQITFQNSLYLLLLCPCLLDKFLTFLILCLQLLCEILYLAIELFILSLQFFGTGAILFHFAL